jgi:tetratricopeptide (TPR) repeat protein
MQKLDYSKTLQNYQKIIDTSPTHELSAKAQYMIGHIYANELNEFEKAKKVYEVFIKQYGTQYPELYESVKFQLEFFTNEVIEAQKCILNSQALFNTFYHY